jgi:drug/metabolite transporter (DMT)-like permease
VLRASILDAWLLLVTIIWGSNFSVIKKALVEIPPIGFNLLRLVLASATLLALLPLVPARDGMAHPVRSLDRGDWIGIAALGLVGHCVYQLAFMFGIAQTSVANTSLIFGCSPIVVALTSAALGHERVAPVRWAGAALSVSGIYLAIGHASRLSADSLRGDAWVAAAMLCWAAYTVASVPLLRRHHPLMITALSMTIGTVLYAPFGVPDLVRLRWTAVTAGAWIGLSASSLLALVFAYVIWYLAVQRLGSTRTAMYSNLVPLVAMAVAAIWLGEPVTTSKIVGTAAVLAGVALTRLEPQGTRARRREV